MLITFLLKKIANQTSMIMNKGRKIILKISYSLTEIPKNVKNQYNNRTD